MEKVDRSDSLRAVASITTWILTIAGPFSLIAAVVAADTIKSALLVCFMSGEVQQLRCVLSHLTSTPALHEFLVKFIAGLWRSYLPAVVLMLALKFVSEIILRSVFRRH